MKPSIAIVDYSMGNLRSVEKALQRAGANAFVTDSPAKIRKAKAVVLPGVGAFGEAMKRLKRGGLVKPLSDALDEGKPFLGICLGLQLLFERSEESKTQKGLGFLKGSVVKFKKRGKLKIPHMGWNTLEQGPAKANDYLKGLSKNDYFYFVHSYFPVPKDGSCVASRTEYGSRFCSAVAKGSLFASQFHPEKSGAQGQRLLKNFVHKAASC